MKAYTDIEQSKRLKEILPLSSADMAWYPSYAKEGYSIRMLNDTYPLDIIGEEHDDIPAWSLAALLDNIPQVKLDNIKQYNKKYWRCCAYFVSDWHNSDWCDNPIDACYEMILELHEQNIL